MKKVIYALIIVAILVGLFIFVEKARAPDENQLPSNNQTKMKLESLAFKEGEFIPSKYTCDELNISPPLSISNVPEGTKTLVLLMDDPDVPKERRPEGYFDHWVIYNIPATVTNFGEGAFSLGNNMADSGSQGLNGRGDASYTGPCPPTEFQPTTHRYFFKLYATDLPTLQFIKAPTKGEVLTAIQGHIIEETSLMGRYDRTKTIKENE